MRTPAASGRTPTFLAIAGRMGETTQLSAMTMNPARPSRSTRRLDAIDPYLHTSIAIELLLRERIPAEVYRSTRADTVGGEPRDGPGPQHSSDECRGQCLRRPEVAERVGFEPCRSDRRRRPNRPSWRN